MAFFVGQLGFEVRMEAELPMGRWVVVAPAGGETAITLVTWFETMEPGSAKGLVLETDDPDAEHARLQDHGLDVTPLEDAPWGRFFSVADPDGNGIVVQRTNPAAPDP